MSDDTLFRSRDANIETSFALYIVNLAGAI